MIFGQNRLHDLSDDLVLDWRRERHGRVGRDNSQRRRTRLDGIPLDQLVLVNSLIDPRESPAHDAVDAETTSLLALAHVECDLRPGVAERAETVLHFLGAPLSEPSGVALRVDQLALQVTDENLDGFLAKSFAKFRLVFHVQFRQFE